MDQELRDFLEQKFTAIDQRFEATSARLDRLQGYMDEKTQESRRHFEVVAERLESRIQLVAEGVAGVDERLDRELTGLREEIAHGNQEILAAVRFS